jgi:hypothetical protein
MKCPKNVPKIIFEDYVEKGITSLSYIMVKYKIHHKEARRIVKILGTIKISKKQQKSEILKPSTPMQELDEYLKTMCRGKKRSGLYQEWEASLHAINNRK